MSRPGGSADGRGSGIRILWSGGSRWKRGILHNMALKRKQILKLLLIDGIARRCAGQFSLSVKWLCAPRGPEAGLVFFFELVLALVARGWFFLLVKWLCAPRGPEAELFFSLSWFSRWWRGAVFSFGQAACAPRGPEVGRGVSTPPSLPLDSTLPATS